MQVLMLTSAIAILLAASGAHSASDAPQPATLPAAILETGPIAGPAPQQREVMQPMSRPLVAVEPTQPVRFAKADAEFQELLGKRLPLPVDGPFADLLRSVKPIPAPAPAANAQAQAELLTARAN